jgi:HlyD family secretion protein
MKRSLILVLLLILSVIAAFGWWNQREKPVPVRLAVVERGEIQQTVTNTRAGSLKACRRAQLSPSAGGTVSRLLADEGQSVKTGDLLLELWNQDLQARLTLSRAQLASSQALQRQSCIQAELAEREAARQIELLRRGLTSDEQAERSSGQARAQRAACDATRANTQVAEAQIAVAEAALEHSRLRVPFDGVVAAVNVELGEYVSPAPVGIPSEPVIDLIDAGCRYIRAPMDEVDAPSIRVGMPARISIDAYPDRFLDGKVRRIADFVLDREKQARTVDIDVDIDQRDDSPVLLPGFTADVEVILAVHPDSLRIPTEALLPGNQVYVYDPDSRSIRQVAIRSGLANWQYTEVLEGLEAGQQVVVNLDAEGLADGVVVRVDKTASR